MEDIKQVGIIGCGARGLHHIGFNMVDSSTETGLVIVGVSNRSKASSDYAAIELEERYAENGSKVEVTRFESYRDMISDPSIDLIIITSHTDAHAEHAIAALESGKKVYLDKPISVTLEDGIIIAEAEKRTGNRLLMGFTRRYEESWLKMKELLDGGAVGSLQMILLRSIIPYSRYLQGWHRKREWSGGPLNDKCSHHFDVFRWMASSDCGAMSAFGGRSGVFKPDPTAPARCSECERECSYRRSEALEELKETVSSTFKNTNLNDQRAIQDACVFSPDSDVEDFGSVNMQLSGGVVGNLFFTIFGPLAPDGETLELVGDSGRLVLSRSDGMIRSYTNHGRETDAFFAGGENFDSSHYGSDKNLVTHMREFCDGAEPVCDAQDGLRSLKMVLGARASFDERGSKQEL
ncbi:MAG: Gfo/Idh/MocA family oxidoreductase [Opitutales bacterium]|nr:Gfo/Idh/MocA family oxidoreductase [Opitutales bacterium]